MLRVFGFYTDDVLYTKHAKILAHSAKRFNIDIDLYEYKSNEWKDIIAVKPSLINKVRKETTGGILYIDSDAIILSDIKNYFEAITEDIAVHYLNDEELLSGTLFINDSDNGRKLIEEWEVRQKNDPARWDQKVLQEIIEDWETKEWISVKRLPPEYTFIFDISRSKYAREITPKIEHLQASRDKHWSEKFKRSNILKRFLLKVPFLKKITRKTLKRQYYTNKRCKQLNIDIRLKLHDLI